MRSKIDFMFHRDQVVEAKDPENRKQRIEEFNSFLSSVDRKYLEPWEATQLLQGLNRAMSIDVRRSFFDAFFAWRQAPGK